VIKDKQHERTKAQVSKVSSVSSFHVTSVFYHHKSFPPKSARSLSETSTSYYPRHVYQ